MSGFGNLRKAADRKEKHMDDRQDRDLDELLAELRDEIARTDLADEGDRESLRALEADIQRLLERSGEERPHAEPELIEQWERSVEALEIEYPALTKLISQVLNALSNAGI